MDENTEFLYTVSCNVDIVECIILLAKGFRPINMLIRQSQESHVLYTCKIMIQKSYWVFG